MGWIAKWTEELISELEDQTKAFSQNAVQKNK